MVCKRGDALCLANGLGEAIRFAAAFESEEDGMYITARSGEQLCSVESFEGVSASFRADDS